MYQFNDYEKLFSHLTPPEPPADLLPKIMRRIRGEQRLRILKWRFGFFVLMLAGSAAGAVLAFQATQSALAESGFGQFFSLLFSDFSAVMTYWDSFLVALLESLPVMSIALFLTTIFIFLNALKYAVRNIKFFFWPREYSVL